MNRQQFSEFIKNPGMTNTQSLKMLDDLVRRYPYCQTGQFLYTYNLFREENLQYPMQLKKAAAYAGDRRVLRELINSAKTKAPLQDSAEIKAPGPVQDVQDLATAALEAETAPEPTADIYPEIFGAVNQEELDAFQALLIEPVPDAMPVFGIINEPGEDEEPIQLVIETSHDRMTHEELLAIVKRRLAEINAEKHKDDHGISNTWHPEYDMQHLFPNEAMPLSPRKKDALINKFILEEPRISKPKVAFFNPSDSAVKSNFDDEEIVSETLAKLYAEQGNISKAVHIYQKLSLLNQEKSRYFAAQIENLKS